MYNVSVSDILHMGENVNYEAKYIKHDKHLFYFKDWWYKFEFIYYLYFKYALKVSSLVLTSLSTLTSQYSWNTANVGIKHQSINQSINPEMLPWVRTVWGYQRGN